MQQKRFRNIPQLNPFADERAKAERKLPVPSIAKLRNGEREALEEFADSYLAFLNANRTPRQRVQSLLHEGVANGFAQDSRTQFWVANEERSAIALVKAGKRPVTEGISVVYAHTDSPCLRISRMPIIYETDALNIMHGHDVHLDTIAHGGIMPHHWVGQQVDVMGYAVNRNRGKIVSRDLPVLPGTIADYTAHIDLRYLKDAYQQMFSLEQLDVSTGLRTPEEVLKAFGFAMEEDFIAADLRVVPTTTARANGNLLVGYGHDDACCLYAGARAIFEAEPTYTTVFVGFDNEEGQVNADDAAGGAFFERVMDEVLTRVPSPDGKARRVRVSQQLHRQVANRSLAVSADVDVAYAYTEKEHSHFDLMFTNVNRRPYLGGGVSWSLMQGVMEGYSTSPHTARRFLEIFKECRAIVQFTNAGRGDEKDSQRAHGEWLQRRGFAVIDAGPPVSGMHSLAERIHKGDLFAAHQFYRGVMERSVRKYV
jgi:aspartyl aminopeptidase